VIQIVCGPYPDEGAFDRRWENEGGKHHETKDFSMVNLKYFDFVDRRIKHLVDARIVPAIVRGWHSYKEAIPHFTGIGCPIKILSICTSSLKRVSKVIGETSLRTMALTPWSGSSGANQHRGTQGVGNTGVGS
jgi:hypothetical protein